MGFISQDPNSKLLCFRNMKPETTAPPAKKGESSGRPPSGPHKIVKGVGLDAGEWQNQGVRNLTLMYPAEAYSIEQVVYIYIYL